MNSRKPENLMRVSFPSRSVNESLSRSLAAAFVALADPTVEELCDIKTAVSEAVTNAIVHGYPDAIGGVTLKLRVLAGNVLELTVRDHGRGIPDVEQAMKAGYSTAPDEVRSLGFGAGMGLPNMKKYTDSMTIDTVIGVGTTITMTVKL